MSENEITEYSGDLHGYAVFDCPACYEPIRVEDFQSVLAAGVQAACSCGWTDEVRLIQGRTQWTYSPRDNTITITAATSDSPRRRTSHRCWQPKAAARCSTTSGTWTPDDSTDGDADA